MSDFDAVQHLFDNGRPGDVIGFSGAKLASDAINVLTYGVPRVSLSHVAILADHEGDLFLYESTTENLEPCQVRGVLTSGTQYTSLTKVKTYKGKVWHYPLYRPLYGHEYRRLDYHLKDALGLEYDWRGAARSGGFLTRLTTSALHEENLNTYFCSELVAKGLSLIGLFPTGNASKWNPNSLVRRCRAMGLLKPPVRLK
jgi:hypothetical protein